MYDVTQSAVLLEGENSHTFDIKQARRGQLKVVVCHLSYCLINQLLDEVEKAGIGITVNNDDKVRGLMLADDFVGLSTNADDLVDVAEGFCNKWRLKSNITMSAVMVFSKGATTGVLKWGDKELPTVHGELLLFGYRVCL